MTKSTILDVVTGERLPDERPLIESVGRGTLQRKLTEAEAEIERKALRILALEKQCQGMRELIDAIDREPKEALRLIMRWRYS